MISFVFVQQRRAKRPAYCADYAATFGLRSRRKVSGVMSCRPNQPDRRSCRECRFNGLPQRAGLAADAPWGTLRRSAPARYRRCSLISVVSTRFGGALWRERFQLRRDAAGAFRHAQKDSRCLRYVPPFCSPAPAGRLRSASRLQHRSVMRSRFTIVPRSPCCWIALRPVRSNQSGDSRRARPGVAMKNSCNP